MSNRITIFRRSFEVQSGRPICSRYKWRFGYFQLVLAYVSFSLGMRPIVEAESPSGAFFVAHAVLMVGVGLPLSYLLSVIAQFSGGGCLQVWKMVPAAWGIGLAVLVTMLINAAINAVTVAYAFYYFIFVLRSVCNCLLGTLFLSNLFYLVFTMGALQPYLRRRQPMPSS